MNMDEHFIAARQHVRTRAAQRYNRKIGVKQLDKIRISLKNKTCFLYREEKDKIIGIVEFGNIHITACYNKSIDCVVTVGCSIPIDDRKKGY